MIRLLLADLKTQTNKELYFRCFLVYNGYHQRAGEHPFIR